MTIPLPRRRLATRLGIPLLIIGGSLFTLAWSAWHVLVPAPLVQPTPVLIRASDASAVSTAAATSSTGTAVQAAGWIEPAPFPIGVPALAEGVVRELLVLDGERIEKDAVVARLVTEDADIAVIRARAEVAARAAAVTIANAGRDRAAIEASTLIEESRAIAVADATVAVAEAAIAVFDAEARGIVAAETEATDALRRLEAARGGGGVSEADLVRATVRVETTRAGVAALAPRRRMLEAELDEAAAEQALAYAERELLVARTAATATAEAAVAGAIADLGIAEAALAEATLRRERMDVRAPAAGIVLSRLAAPGMRVGGEGSPPVVQLYDPSSLQVRADVANADIALVGVGTPATITVEALPNRTLAGHVTRIVGQADLQKNTVQVKIAIESPPEALRPDMLCRVRLGGSTGSDAGPSASRMRLFVPAALVAGDTVVRLGPVERGVARAATRKIELGAVDGDWIEVVRGLAPGDLLVDPSIEDGTIVRVAREDSNAV